MYLAGSAAVEQAGPSWRDAVRYRCGPEGRTGGVRSRKVPFAMPLRHSV